MTGLMIRCVACIGVSVLLSVQSGPATAQGAREARPSLPRVEEPLRPRQPSPPALREDEQGSRQDGGADDEPEREAAPPFGGGCPYRGRNLELIV